MPAKFSPNWFKVLLFFPLWNTVSILCAADITDPSAGNWNAPGLETLAEALQNVSNGDHIDFYTSVTGGWTNWPSGNGYTVMSAPYVSSGTLTFNLNGYVISGTPLDVVTGNATFLFNNGTLGAAGTNFGIGVNGDSNVTLQDTYLLADLLRIGSETTQSHLTLSTGSTAAVTTLNVIGSDSLLMLGSGATINAPTFSISNGGTVVSNGGAINSTNLTVEGYLSQATFNGGTLNTSNLSILDGGTFLSAGATITISNDLTVSGVAVVEESGVFTFAQTTLGGSGTLSVGGNLVFDGGANVDISSLLTSFMATAAQSLTVDGIFTHTQGAKSFQTTVKVNGDLSANAGGTINVTNGADLSGVTTITANGGTVTVAGTALSAADGKKYQSAIHAGGALTISGSGTVDVKGGGLINGVTGITVGDNSAGTLNISNMDAATNWISEVNATGSLIVGNNAAGTLNITGGGALRSGETRIGLGASDGTKVSVSGAGTGSIHSRMDISGDFYLSDTGNAEMLVQQGAQIAVSGNAYLGNTAGKTATLELKQRGGTDIADARLAAAGQIIVGNDGDVLLSITTGGGVTSGLETILGKGATSNVTVTIDSDHYRSAWNAGGTALTPGSYVAPEGNASLDVKGGLVTVSGLFAMAGQDPGYVGDFGTALFHTGGELHMSGGSFFNMNTSDFIDGVSLGKTTIGSGGIVSGSGYIYAGEQFIVDGGTIAPGSRHMYDFSRTDPANLLSSLGWLHIYDRDDVDTLFHGATFRTELDRPIQGTGALGGYNSSDHATVHGNLEFDSAFTVDISRPLDGQYMIINTVDGNIFNFTPQELSALGATDLRLNLNGKLLKGNDRIDFLGGMYTTIENGNTEIWLTVNTTSDGNVKTYWIGEGDLEWSMRSHNNFDATLAGNSSFSGDDQFLDGDIVFFDYSIVTDPLKRVATVAQESYYVGDDFWYKPSDTGNVRVAEVNVLGNDDGTSFIWQGGSIYALDSALHSTLDKVDGDDTPSGRLNKIGTGVLEIYNANEFYGGIHLGDDFGTTGGRIILHNNRGFGTYDSTSGLQQKGLVTVHENTTIEMSDPNMTINNRFIVMDGKVLTFEFPGDFTIAGNNALASDSTTRDGKGGGVFVGDGGQIVYTGTGRLLLQSNKAKAGGGIYTELGYTLQVPAYISGNYASGAGGGIYAERYFELKDGSDIRGNAAQSAGGGIYVGNRGTMEPGDEFFIIHGNSQIVENLSGGETGGGVYVDAGHVLQIATARKTGGVTTFGGGDVWFEGNYAMVGFDADNPAGGPKDMSNAFRNAIHLSRVASVGTGDPAIMEISGPYNTYFYDAISGDTETLVTISGVPAIPGVNTESAHGVTPGQPGTVVFHADSAFYGNTEIKDGATFRLETDAGDEAVYGRRGSLAPTAPASNTFMLDALSWMTGQGTIVADNILLNGKIDLDTGTFTRPVGKDGSGTVSDIGTGQGILALDGGTTIANTSEWFLTLGTGNTTDRVDVTGNVDFTGGTPGNRMTFAVDDVIRGKYAVLTATEGISNYQSDPKKSDALIMHSGGNLVKDFVTSTDDPMFGRLKATSYVDATGHTLYLDIGGRNRFVTASSGGTWAYDDSWDFDASYIPMGTGGTTVWSRNTAGDSGPATSVYLDGDMVLLTGGSYTLTGRVNPVDLFVEHASNTVTITGTGGISTFSTAATSTTASKGQDASTIGTSGTNDYDIRYYTGKLYKSGTNTLTFSNTGGNLFSEGITFGFAAGNAGVVSFNNVNQLTVGASRTIDFNESGTLQFTGTTGTLTTSAGAGTGIRVADTQTATFDIADALTVSGVISNLSGNGAIAKTSAGMLTLSGANTFTGGTTLDAGTISIGSNTALGTYTTAGGIAGRVDVTGAGTITNSAARTIRNRFIIDTAAAGLTFGNTAALTINNVNADNAIDGGAVYVGSTANQLAFSGAGALTFSNNQARSGGAIYDANTSALTIGKAITFTGNRALAGDGGGLYAAGNVSLSSTSTITNNTATQSGGGLYSEGIVTLNTTQTITGNTADIDGGAIWAKGIVLSGTATISGNTAGNRGGAFFVDTGLLSLTATAATNTITFQNNTAINGSGVFLANGADATIGGAGNTIFNSDTLASDGSGNVLTKSGTGTLAFIGTNGTSSDFIGTTNVNEGMFRITTGVEYGNSTTGTLFTLAAAATPDDAKLTGGGKLKAETFELYGIVSPDNVVGSAAPTTQNIGTLNFIGDVNMYGNGTPGSYQYAVDLGTQIGATDQGNADKLFVTGTFNAITGGDKIIVDVYNYNKGVYLLIDTTAGLLVNGSSTGDVDGIVGSGAFDVLVHNFEKTDRHRVEFARGTDPIMAGKTTSDTAAADQLWLVADYNNLYMYWTGVNTGDGAANLWQGTNNEANGNWLDKLVNGETHFENRDAVAFVDTIGGSMPTPTNKAITLGSNVTVTEMLVDTTGTYSFAGTGFGISTSTTYEGDILDPYFTSGITQQLIKKGTGTLTFTNTGANNFAGGIVFDGTGNAGSITFTAANQLGDGGNGITFLQNGTLQANAAATLTNNLKIDDTKTAMFNTNGFAVTLSGKIDDLASGDEGLFTKTGTGTLTLTNTDNSWHGQTTITTGTLQANGVGTLGYNNIAHQIVNNAALDLNIATGPQTLSQWITGTGNVTKTGAAELIFDQVNNTYSGNTTVAAGMLTVKHAEQAGNNGGLGTGNVVVSVTGAGTGLNFDIEENGTFSKVISGAGNVTKSGAYTLTLSGTSTYTGTTNVTGGKVILTNVAGTGQNTTGTTTSVSLASGTELEINVAGTYNKQITGAGKLTANIPAAGTIELTGNNNFTGGTDLVAGTILVGHDTALGTYTGIGTAGVVNYVGDNTTVRSTTAGRAVTNHFVVDDDVTGAKLEAVANLTVQKADSGGGAVSLGTNAEMTLDANGGSITFGTNGTNASPDVTMAAGSELTLNATSAASANGIFINSGIAGDGTINKTGAGIVQVAETSAFDGATTISAGTFRIVDNKTFGDNATAFTLNSGATLAGQGTIKAAEISLAGTVTPDTAKFTAGGSTDIAGASLFGTITLDGKVDLTNTFVFNYNAGTPIASSTVTTGYSGTTGDLIKMQNGGVGGYTINDGATVNFVDALVSGKYLIFTADQDFTLVGGSTLDGIKAGGIVKATGVTNTQSPRGSFEFIWGLDTDEEDILSQIWLDMDRNTLEMTWQDSSEDSVWKSGSGGANFLSTQFRMDGLTKVQEQMFNDGDYVIFDTKGTDKTITIGDAIDTNGVIVSGMYVNANSNYTFNGDGITAYVTHATIEGDYIPGGVYHSGTEPVNPDGKLQKSGTGTLTFANGANQFTKGIEINAGTIAFSNANQLGTLDTDGTTDNGITFRGTGVLQANATGQNVTNKITINAGQTANINTQAYDLTLSGQISGNALTKSAGSGTLILTNTANDYTGLTTVTAGTLRVTGDASGTALGSNTATATHYVTIASGATLELTVASGVVSTLAQQITGAGLVVKTNAGEQILTHNNSTYSGGTTVTSGTLTGWYAASGANAGSFGTGTINNTAALVYDMHAAGTANNLITGTGSFTKTQTSGQYDLILTNVANTFSGGITVTGGVSGVPNYLIANDSRSLGAIDSTTRTITLSGVYDYLQINESTQNNTISNKITGSGGLEKTGSFATTLTNANDFTGGTKQNAGTLVLGNTAAVGTYSTPGATSGTLNIVGNSTTTLGVTGTYQNRFVVEPGVNWTLNNANATMIAGVHSGITGGAMYLGAGSTTNIANTGSLTFSGNTGAAGSDNDVYLNSAVMNFTGVGNQFFNSGIAGTGMINQTGSGMTQIGADSAFAGITNIDDGFFRVVQNQTYGSTGATFSLGGGGTLAGGGTIQSGTMMIEGIISPDNDTLSATKSAVDVAHQIGTLTLEGDVTLDGFIMTYHDGTSKSTKETAANINTGDLLRIVGTTSPLLVGGTIDIQHLSLSTGWYLIAESETAFDTGGADLDGITGSGVLHLTRFGAPVRTESPRNWYEFEFGQNADGIDDARIWLHANINSLTMNWIDANGTWDDYNEANIPWQSEQFNLDALSNPVYSERFRQGDYVRFNVSADSTIEMMGNYVVSGFTVTGSFDTTFTGDGGVHSKTEDDWIIGKYLPGGIGYVDPQKLDPDGKLIKTGTGTLTFENIGGNLFDEGIEIAAGTVGFNNGNQLQVGNGKAITFTGVAANNAKLQANASTTLAADIIATAGNKGTIDTLANMLTHTGNITANGAIELTAATGGFLFQDGAVTGTGTITKIGAGTTQIGADSAFSGTTIVDAGIFRVVKEKTYGTTSAAFTLEDGATLAGGGTVKAALIDLNGIVNPDSAALSATKTAVDNAHATERFGTLTLDGKVHLSSTFLYNYDPGTPHTARAATTDYTVANIHDGIKQPTGDLIMMINGGTGGYFIDEALVNFTRTLTTGKYLIFVADEDFTLGGTGTLDGIKSDGVVKATIPDFDSPRGGFRFVWGNEEEADSEGNYNSAFDIHSQIWLDVNRNTLEMTWQDSPEDDIWTSSNGGANFISTQSIDTPLGPNHEQMFNDGDYVLFKDITDTDKTISISGGRVIVSGMNVGADDTNYTFTGSDGITALVKHDTIEGFYLPEGGVLPTVVPDGKLIKDGSGTLTFENTGGNLFNEGVDLLEGILAFTNGNQLQVGSSKTITFLNNATLQSNADANLATNIMIANGKEATINTNGNTLTYSGVINDAVNNSKLVKEGEGTLILTERNYYGGGTEILEGTVAIANDNRLGTSDSVVINGGTLRAIESFTSERIAELGTNDGTLEADPEKTLTWNGKVTGPGNLTTTGKGTVVLTNLSNNYEGSTTVADGRLIAVGLDALGENIDSRSLTTKLLDPITKTRSVLELQISGEETLYQELLGDGEVCKTGVGGLIFATDSPDFEGHFNFAEGNVYLNGTLFKNSGSFLIADGVTLFGTGWLGSRNGEGILSTGGTLIPGGVTDNGLGTPTADFLHISGNLTFENGSLFEVVITQYLDPAYDPSNPERMRPVNDKIIVDEGGWVMIHDGAELNLIIDFWKDSLDIYSFNEKTSDRFTIIDATDGHVDDPHSKFSFPEPEMPRGVELAHGWNGSLYQIWFLGDPAGFYVNLAKTHNQKEVGKVLDYLTRTNDPGMKELLLILAQRDITDDRVLDVIKQLSGDLRANSLGMALKRPWRHSFNRIDRDMFPRDFDPCRPVLNRPEYKYTNEYWVEGYGQYTDNHSDGNAYSHSTRQEGTVFGLDRHISKRLLIGGVFNGSQAVLQQATGKVRMEDFEIGLYSLTKLTECFDLKSYIGYSHQEYYLKRHVFIPAGERYDALYESYRNETNGNMLSMSFELQRPWDYNDYLVLTPLIAIDHEHVWQKGYKESGGLLALKYDDTNLERTMFRVGLNMKFYAADKLDISGRVQYATQLNKMEYPRSRNHFISAASAYTPAMDVHGSSMGRDNLNLGISGEYYLDRHRASSLHFGYDADLWHRSAAHTGYFGSVHRW